MGRFGDPTSQSYGGGLRHPGCARENLSGVREGGVPTGVKELVLVDGGATRGLEAGGGARGPWAGRGPVAGCGTMGMRASGGATHTYRDSKKVSLHIR
jgi:hypothetical protein